MTIFKCEKCGFVKATNKLNDDRFYCPNCGKNLGCYTINKKLVKEIPALTKKEADKLLNKQKEDFKKLIDKFTDDKLLNKLGLIGLMNELKKSI